MQYYLLFFKFLAELSNEMILTLQVSHLHRHGDFSANLGEERLAFSYFEFGFNWPRMRRRLNCFFLCCPNVLQLPPICTRLVVCHRLLLLFSLEAAQEKQASLDFSVKAASCLMISRTISSCYCFIQLIPPTSCCQWHQPTQPAAPFFLISLSVLPYRSHCCHYLVISGHSLPRVHRGVPAV